MARHRGRGSSRPTSSECTVDSALSRTLRGSMSSESRHASIPSAFTLAVLIAGAILLMLAGVQAAIAQASVPEVHIKPRVEPTPVSADAGIDPALKTHTKQMKVDVDLVLVPVTITDPMNRLVTGLDKDNFSLYENKDEQVIRHFSSEDAPVSIGVIFDMSGSMGSKIERAREAVV
jgi:Ca-activated chloride channel family protein